MQDFRGDELIIGDRVIIGGGYRRGSAYLQEAYVVEFTPKSVRVSASPNGEAYIVVTPSRLCKDYA